MRACYLVLRVRKSDFKVKVLTSLLLGTHYRLNIMGLVVFMSTSNLNNFKAAVSGRFLFDVKGDGIFRIAVFTA